MADTSENRLIQARENRDVSFFDLTSIEDMTDADIRLIFDLARIFRDIQTEKLTLCKGRSMVNCFFESSTRTMSSFDLSGKHLGMDTVSV